MIFSCLFLGRIKYFVFFKIWPYNCSMVWKHQHAFSNQSAKEIWFPLICHLFPSSNSLLWWTGWGKNMYVYFVWSRLHMHCAFGVCTIVWMKKIMVRSKEPLFQGGEWSVFAPSNFVLSFCRSLIMLKYVLGQSNQCQEPESVVIISIG